VNEAFLVRKRRVVRDELGRVALRLFAERGFEAVTVEDIAQAAGISPRSFFRYFATKDEVVFDYERAIRARLVHALDERPASEGAVTALRNAYVATAHVEPSDRARVVAMGRILDAAPALRAKAHGERMADDSALIERVAKRLGVRSSDQRARTVVASMSAVAGVEFQAWVASGGRGDPSEAIARALVQLERGLAELDRTTQPG
jgi:AcrR family transcriptional regulator